MASFQDKRSLKRLDKSEASSEPKTKRSVVDSKSACWIQHSAKHRNKFEQLVSKSCPQSITIIHDNRVCLQKEFFIGSGSRGTAVYICLGCDGVERAIKFVPKHLCQKLLDSERNILNSYKAMDSPRIVSHWNSGIFGNDSCYLILNLYEQNLEDYVQENGERITKSRAREMIYQVLQGLKALHESKPRILHRDLKPSNILVDVNGDLALSDFGVGKILSAEGKTTHYISNECRSLGWTAYESTNWDRWFPPSKNQTKSQVKPECKRQTDIQVAGMIAFYIHSKGKHPFGDTIIERIVNLRDDHPVGLAELIGDADAFLKDLLFQMLARDFNKRPYVEQVLKHPYFLSPGEQMKLVEAVGNEREIKQGDPNCAVSSGLDNLDSSNPRSSLLPEDWKAVIDPDDLNIFCEGGRGSSSYDGKRYTDCLRFIRNVCQHWDDRPRQPLNDMGTASSLDEYFLQLFPALPLVLHQIIRKHPDWKARSSLKEFFPLEANQT